MNKNPIEWRDRILNTKSRSFCGSKWLNATIWLGSGATASCHHPPPHRIDASELEANPSALHNTVYKKLIRKQMLEGERPKECEYCWKIEDLGPQHVSDRYYKSVIYTEDELTRASQMHWTEDATPINLEIAFDTSCNFACSYCNASFSTTWGHDIKASGPYQDLKSDGAGAYTHDGSWAQPFGQQNKNNPYVAAFWKWWESDLQFKLRQLRITGGEATTSHDFWKLIDWYEQHPDCQVELAVNSNLGIKRKRLDQLCKASHSIKRFSIFTSNESVGPHAEYIRDGLIWDEWLANIRYILTNGRLQLFHLMMTINALSLASIGQMQEEIIKLRKEYPHISIDMSYNILRFPSLQSITTLPLDIRNERAAFYKDWLARNRHQMHDHEIDRMSRTIAYISEVTDGHDRSTDLISRQHDFASFYQQYDKRRNKSLATAFADWPALIEWVKTIHVDSIQTEKSVGDATDWGKPMYDEVMISAREAKII